MSDLISSDVFTFSSVRKIAGHVEDALSQIYFFTTDPATSCQDTALPGHLQPRRHTLHIQLTNCKTNIRNQHAERNGHQITLLILSHALPILFYDHFVFHGFRAYNSNIALFDSLHIWEFLVAWNSRLVTTTITNHRGKYEVMQTIVAPRYCPICFQLQKG